MDAAITSLQRCMHRVSIHICGNKAKVIRNNSSAFYLGLGHIEIQDQKDKATVEVAANGLPKVSINLRKLLIHF